MKRSYPTEYLAGKSAQKNKGPAAARQRTHTKSAKQNSSSAFNRVTRFALQSTALVPFVFLATPAWANCVTDSSNIITTCTGDPFPYLETVPGGSSNAAEYYFQDFSTSPSNGSNSAVIEITSEGSKGSSHGDNGKQGTPIDLYYDGGSYTMNSSQESIIVKSTGGEGHSGKDRTGTAGINGGDAGHGGAGGGLYFEWIQGGIFTQSQMEFVSQGGTGGQGGTGHADSGNSHGGLGGDGGAGGVVSLQLAVDSDVSGSAGPIRAWSIGGDGGKGGRASAPFGQGTGKHGGFGGAGGLIDINIYNDYWHAQSSYQSTFGGLYARSKAGDGGNGGNAKGDISDSAAGNGGHGGDGGDINILTDGGTVSFDIEEGAGYTSAIYAVSSGGDGGHGGDGDTSAGKAKGGDGGSGGEGGNINIDVEIGAAGLTTEWYQTQGVFAQSVGGSGGDGGSGSGGLGSGKGGGSAKAGHGGTVNINLTGTFINTKSYESNAVIAQSIGGFAGDSGDGSGFVAYGADAQSGGSGGEVTVTLQPHFEILTQGDSSSGIIAQSIGGGGGRGGSGSGLTSMGGFGSSGGDGGTVNVNVMGNASITTYGESSYAIEAQSIGGSGGSAGASKGLVSMGGSAGSGGNGGSVNLYIVAPLKTTGNYSDAVIAQSIGGGGGNAHSTSGMLAIGGSGGEGGSGGNITAYHVGGNIYTTGEDADAVVLQSIGGGGGSGSNSFAAGAQFSSAIGGQGGSGGAGGNVHYEEQGSHTISTEGDNSTGVLLQSIGGGGGNGGYAISASAGVAFDMSVGAGGSGSHGGSGGVVYASLQNAVSTIGAHSIGVQAQSIGGGGGNGGMAISSANTNGVAASAAVGGSGGSGGNGGTVYVSTLGSVYTQGDSSTGIMAQSVGGGGGSSGLTIDANAVSNMSAAVAIGQGGGSGGNGGDVSVIVSNGVTTKGASSDAILAQSIGGSGGNASAVIAASGVSQSNSLNVAVGGAGGSGGNAGKVSITVEQPAVDTGYFITAHGDGSNGIVGQSIGGSGGNGSLSVAGSLSSNNAIDIAIGGSGGGGGHASSVDIFTNVTIETYGDNSHGILAQSIGGSGGNGGMSIAGAAMSGNTANVAVSGSGGNGNTSGDVTVTVDHHIFTYGDVHASAIKAMSIAGGGGNATAAITGSTSQMGEAGVTLGGGGGGGGTAGDVIVNVSGGVLHTIGDYSDGIWAGSVGGGGGHGAFAAQGSLSAGEYSSTNNVTIGGQGGTGGAAGDVSVATIVDTSEWNIYTTGYQSRGIYASSVGGSGGNGGSAYSGSLVFSEDVGMTVGVSIGGAGGSGGIGGDVSVVNEYDIQTEGHYSDGIFAQSVGGDGGNGGNSVVFAGQAAKSSSLNFAVAVGGNGGTGAHAGKVNIYNFGDLTMTGLESHGIYAQSVGGGGGRGGNAGTVLIDATASQKDSSEKNITMNVGVQVGGLGGSGGDGKAVTVENYGSISVGYQLYEDDELVDDRTAFGIFAQSVGGGGGDGGSSSGYLLSVSGDCTASGLKNYAYQCEDSSGVKSNYAPTLQSAVGGNGGSAGDGNTVTVDNNAAIKTSGTGSHAIFAQSVGGGGGAGGYGALGSTKAIAPNGTVSDVSETLKRATDKYSNTKQFQTVNIIVGGQGGSGGDGGTVDVVNAGDITTYGEAADAIFAQSIGGGGGHGGTAYSGLGQWIQVGVGGAGSGGGHGGSVTVESSGSIVTYEDDAMGIFAQSVGGGGGRAGTVSRSLNGILGTNLNIGKGVGSVLSAGDGGNGGKVEVTLEAGGGIWTYGDYAHGIVAQSIGGGGGAAHIENFENKAFSFAGGNGEDGNGGDITITIDSPIVVAGYGAHAVFAQSTSGEDKDGDLGADAGDITVNINSSISATGEEGRGILLQSDGLFDSGQISLTISADGSITTGVNGGDTIALSHGQDNVIENHGYVTKGENSSSTNYALRTFAGQLDFQNYGYFRGSVLLADEDELGLTNYTNTFTNEVGGTLALGQEFNLGRNSSTLSNAGTMTPKNIGSIGSTSFTGTLTQSSKGIYWADFQFNTQADLAGDLITVETGGTASLAGSVYPYPIETVPADGAAGGIIIFYAPTGGLSADSLTVANTATVEYGLIVGNDGSFDRILLQYEVDYSGQLTATSATPTYSENFYKVADYISLLAASRVQEYDNGGSKFEFIEEVILPILRVPTHDELAEVYWHLTPADLHRNSEANMRSSQSFAGNLMSCPDLSGTNTYAFRYEGNCAWSQVSVAHRSVNEHGNNLDYEEQTWRYSTGVQSEIKEDWFLGGAVALEHADTTTGISTGSIDRFHIGGVLKHEVGDTNYAVSLSAGHSENEITRNFLTSFGNTPEAFNTTDNWVSAHGRIAHLFKSSGGSYFEPFADVGITWLMGHDTSFGGALPANLDIQRSDLFQYSTQAGFSVGRSINTPKAVYDIGMNFSVLSTFGGDFASSVNFSDSPDTSIALNTESEELVFDIGAHASAQIGEQTSLRVNFGAQLGEYETGYGADFRFSHQF